MDRWDKREELGLDYDACTYRECVSEREDGYLGLCMRHEKRYHDALDDIIAEAEEADYDHE